MGILEFILATSLLLVWVLGGAVFHLLCKVHDVYQGPGRYPLTLFWPLVVAYLIMTDDTNAPYRP